MNKRESLAGMMTPAQKEEIRALQEAVSKYSLNSNDITYGEVLMAFFGAVREAGAAFCPVESMNPEEKSFEPGKVKTTVGKCYVLCSSPEEAALCPEEVIVLIGMDHIVAMAADDPACGGLVLNPYGGHPCTFPREYIQRILKREQKQDLPEKHPRNG